MKKMKIKNKVLALLEIAIVLCSVFLVATLPAAAITNYESGITNYEEAAQEDKTLGIYGNANEDDTIDMRDLTYVKLIFFGKKPVTKLADAKYDGKINPLDFIQIKLIIVGKEKELTVVDTRDRIVTIKKPVKRIVVTTRGTLETLRSLKVENDRIVGVESLVQVPGRWGINYKVFFPEFQDVPTVGLVWTPDCEVVLGLHPDIVFLTPSAGLGGSSSVDHAADLLESAGITVLRLKSSSPGLFQDHREGVKKLGYIFGKRDEAEELLEWHEKIRNFIKKKVEKIPEKDKPKVYIEKGGRPYGLESNEYGRVEMAGGKDIFADLNYGVGDMKVDPEAVIERDPDIVVKGAWIAGGYHMNADDTAELKEIREEIMSRPELQKVKAVKNKKIYTISGYILGYGPASGCRGFLEILYLAKWFHPELFEDLDPKAIHQEYLTRFQELDIDLDEQGVFVYPEPS